MMNRLSPQRRMVLRERLRSLDRAAADLNVILFILALGLATLDFTFLVSIKVAESLPQVTHVAHVTYDAPQPSNN